MHSSGSPLTAAALVLAGGATRPLPYLGFVLPVFLRVGPNNLALPGPVRFAWKPPELAARVMEMAKPYMVAKPATKKEGKDA